MALCKGINFKGSHSVKKRKEGKKTTVPLKYALTKQGNKMHQKLHAIAKSKKFGCQKIKKSVVNKTRKIEFKHVNSTFHLDLQRHH